MLTLPRYSPVLPWHQQYEYKKWLTLIFAVASRHHGYTMLIGEDDHWAHVDQINHVVFIHQEIPKTDLLIRHDPGNLLDRMHQWLSGVVAHEAAHVRFSRERPTHPVVFNIWNCIEDERIERLMVKEFPSLRQNFTMMGDVLLGQNEGKWDRTAQEGILFWRFEHDRTSPRWKPIESEAELWDRIRPLVEEGWTAPTSARVSELSYEIADILKLNITPPAEDTVIRIRVKRRKQTEQEKRQQQQKDDIQKPGNQSGEEQDGEGQQGEGQEGEEQGADAGAPKSGNGSTGPADGQSKGGASKGDASKGGAPKGNQPDDDQDQGTGASRGNSGQRNDLAGSEDNEKAAGSKNGQAEGAEQQNESGVTDQMNPDSPEATTPASWDGLITASIVVEIEVVDEDGEEGNQPGGEGAGFDPQNLPEPPKPREIDMSAMAANVEGYAMRLAPLLKPLEKPGHVTPHRSKGRYRYDRDLRGDEKIFVKKTLPSRQKDIYLDLLIDRSGSMGSYNRMETAKTSLIMVMKAAALSHSRVRVTAFDDYPLTIIGEPDRHTNVVASLKYTDAVKLISGIQPGGGTRLYPALHKVLDNAPKLPNEVHIIAIICDGDLGEQDAVGCAALAKQAALQDVRFLPVLIGEAAASASSVATWTAIFGMAKACPNIEAVSVTLLDHLTSMRSRL